MSRQCGRSQALHFGLHLGHHSISSVYKDCNWQAPKTLDRNIRSTDPSSEDTCLHCRRQPQGPALLTINSPESHKTTFYWGQKAQEWKQSERQENKAHDILLLDNKNKINIISSSSFLLVWKNPGHSGAEKHDEGLTGGTLFCKNRYLIL